jgi:propanol-preferring alcohol dehydrogenase
MIPGHQIVGEVVESRSAIVEKGSRVGVSWVGGTDGTCSYCQEGKENLCDNPVYTGYGRDGGFADYAVADANFVLPLPNAIDDLHVAPLLCAGIIGYRSLKMAEVKPKQKIGLFGFGSSAHRVIRVLQYWGCKVYVSTRGEGHQSLARTLGADWVGTENEEIPAGLDAAITFAPSGDVVLAALRTFRKGGIVAINAIHLDRFPCFDYNALLWGERQIRSVTNMTRADGREFLALAEEIGLEPSVRQFRLRDVNDALMSVRHDEIQGSAVVVP